jgi:hypothetical protein
MPVSLTRVRARINFAGGGAGGDESGPLAPKCGWPTVADKLPPLHGTVGDGGLGKV